MYLFRLIYASEQSSLLSRSDIEQILAVSQTNNQKADVTGLLCFNNPYFLQCLEGSRASVNATFNRIQKDSRHANLVIISYHQIAERSFEQWSMGYVGMAKFQREALLKYSVNQQFDPFSMSDESSLAFLFAMAKGLMHS